MNQLTEDLIDLELLLEEPAHWAHDGSWARNSIGIPLMWNDPLATCWCLVGGVFKTTGYKSGDSNTPRKSALMKVLREAVVDLGYPESDNLIGFNDDAQHEQVIAVIRHAREMTDDPA